ncbi:toxin-activating lysine-acyltransferase [Lelliottia amnigena]|uniref:toxin-activating lysine-acyltransferase n=1 Tax=Lelliottia amnigena TaxID=61646 RepID=UPI004057AA3F
MRFEHLDITAPLLLEEPWNEASALGAAVWLWMHSKTHRNAPLHTLPTVLLPALKHRQFILASEAGKPVFFMSWLALNEESERRFLNDSPLLLSHADWNSGDRLWFEDWIAPFGHSAVCRRLLQHHLFPARCARYLHHQGEHRGLRIKTFRGIQVTHAQAAAWFAARPLPTAL